MYKKKPRGNKDKVLNQIKRWHPKKVELVSVMMQAIVFLVELIVILALDQY